LAAQKPARFAKDLQDRPRGWLFDGAHRMRKAVLDDFKEYSR